MTMAQMTDRERSLHHTAQVLFGSYGFDIGQARHHISPDITAEEYDLMLTPLVRLWLK